jgi:hypothetical protein
MENCLKNFLYACGPAAMLKELQRSPNANIPGQVALEDHFGCGLVHVSPAPVR